jgi:hypothetical protein
MAEERHLTILARGVGVWNDWRHSAEFEIPDLSSANLGSADLKNADLSWASLCRADLSRANLDHADLNNADLDQADLTDADLSCANLREASLNRANLRHGNLFQARLSGASLRNADIRDANLNEANLSDADLSEARLNGSSLQGTTLVNTNLKGADLTGCRVFGVSAWKLDLSETTQQALLITDMNEPEITVDNLEVAQFIYLLLHNEKIRQVIDTITSKVVLILGRFDPERKLVLDRLRVALRDRDYLPVIFDFDPPAHRNLTETVSTLAHMARFVIADITDPRSIPQELQRIIPNLPSLPVQPVIQAPEQPWGMFRDYRDYPWLLEPYSYSSLDQLLGVLDEEVIAPAERMASDIARRRLDR